MTPKELEDEIIDKVEALYDRAVIARNAFDNARITAQLTYEEETHRIETERLRVLMDHTVKAMRIK